VSERPGTISANFHLTHNCNLRCTYCYTGEKFGAGMTAETADRAVDFCLEQARRSGAGHLELVFFGGEPLMKLDLLCRIADRALDRAGDLRVSSKLSTNGVLLTEQAVSRLAPRGVYVSISLDGDPQLQAAQRPDAAGRDISRRLDEAITRLLEWNPCASVNCVVTPASGGRLDASVRWLSERGFAYVQTALDYSARWTRRDLVQLQLRQAYLRLADWYVERTIAGSKFYLSCFDQRIRSWTRGPLQPSERCFIGQRQFSIAPSGRVRRLCPVGSLLQLVRLYQLAEHWPARPRQSAGVRARAAADADRRRRGQSVVAAARCQFPAQALQPGVSGAVVC
jgi:uncharacterized protein